MGTSFAFEARPEDAARYYRRSFDAQMEAKDLAGAAGTANALGRVYLESGNTQKAEQWYRTGYETARRIPHMPAAQLALWDMRWAHAQGRIAARRGQRAQALQHAAVVKRLLPTVADENQRAAYPYLVGYIDFYTRHYKTAIESLKAGSQEDVLRARPDRRVDRKLHDAPHAREYFERVLAGTGHNINAAFSRPAARVVSQTTAVVAAGGATPGPDFETIRCSRAMTSRTRDLHRWLILSARSVCPMSRQIFPIDRQNRASIWLQTQMRMKCCRNSNTRARRDGQILPQGCSRRKRRRV